MPGSSLSPVVDSPLSPYTFSDLTTANYNATADTINLGTAHNFITGNSIWLTSDGSAGTAQTGGVAKQRYFVIVVDSTTIKLATTSENATSGIALDLSTPSAYGASSSYFSKFPGISIGLPIPLSAYPAYAKSSVIFNSSTPAEISFTVPAFTTITSSEHYPMLCIIRQSGSESYWGGVFSQVSNNNLRFSFFDGGTTVVAQVSNPLSTAFTLGYNQKYVITSSRTIQIWLSGTNLQPTLYYTTPALTANTSLVLEFASSFSFAKVQDCIIKYL